jgi:hypothetical protein
MKTPSAFPRLLVALVALLGFRAFAAEETRPDKKVVDAYSNYVCFVLFQVAEGTPAEKRQCHEEVGEAIVEAWSAMSAEERAQLARMPSEWAMLQESWARLDEAEKDLLRAQWAMMLQAELGEGDTAVGGAGQGEETP